MLMHKQPKNASAADALDFFKWAFENGQARPKNWTTCRCRRNWSKQIESYWKTEIKSGHDECPPTRAPFAPPCRPPLPGPPSPRTLIAAVAPRPRAMRAMPATTNCSDGCWSAPSCSSCSPWPAPRCRCCGAAAKPAEQGLSFFFSADWNPVENKFGALVPIYGTLVTASSRC
jgi:hypothetical protein